MPELKIPEAKPVEMSAHDRLAAAEKRMLGENPARHNGKIEDGHGSRHSMLHDAQKAHLAAIHALIEAEKEHVAAESHLAAVHAKVAKAKAQVDATEETALKSPMLKV